MKKYNINPKLTIQENAEQLGIKYFTLAKYCKRNGIKCAECKHKLTTNCDWSKEKILEELKKVYPDITSWSGPYLRFAKFLFEKVRLYKGDRPFNEFCNMWEIYYIKKGYSLPNGFDPKQDIKLDHISDEYYYHIDSENSYTDDYDDLEDDE